MATIKSTTVKWLVRFDDAGSIEVRELPIRYSPRSAQDWVRINAFACLRRVSAFA